MHKIAALKVMFDRERWILFWSGGAIDLSKLLVGEHWGQFFIYKLMYE